MKMLTLVCGEKIEEEIVVLLRTNRDDIWDRQLD